MFIVSMSDKAKAKRFTKQLKRNYFEKKIVYRLVKILFSCY